LSQENHIESIIANRRPAFFGVALQEPQLKSTMKRKINENDKNAFCVTFPDNCPLACYLSQSPISDFAEEPPGCPNERFLRLLLPCFRSSRAYAVGQEIRFVVTLENPTFNGAGLANCNISNIWMILTKPDSSVIPIVTNQNLVAGGGAIVCPGDPACLSPSNSFNYTIRQEDLTNINVSVCSTITWLDSSLYRHRPSRGDSRPGRLWRRVNDNKCANAQS
jgi:hypothetical protein